MLAVAEAKRAPDPPGPKGTLLAGSNREFAKRRLPFLLELAHVYGPVVGFRLGPRKVVLVSEPSLIEQILVTDAKRYIKHFGARAYKVLLGNGLVTSEGELWREQRRLIQPAFHKTPVQAYASDMSALAAQMLERWQPGQRIDVHGEFTSLAGCIALKTLFGLDNPGDQTHFASNLRIAVDLVNARLRALLKFPYWMPTPANRRLKRLAGELFQIADRFIEESTARGEDTSNLISSLVRLAGKQGTSMSTPQLRDEAMTLYISAHETTALGLTWTWYLLSRHPEAEQKLVAEWGTVLDGRNPVASDLSALPYTMAVIAESLRLYPPVPLVGREATDDVELGGFRVRRGGTILISPWVCHRDPSRFPDPEAFRPERWTVGLAHDLHRFAYIPFGGGPRVCIGRNFALTEIALVLATLGQHYRFTTEDGETVGINPQITLQPARRIHARLQPRTR